MLTKIKSYFASFDPRQKLNVIYFISASKTRSFSISIYMLSIMAAFAFIVVIWAAFGVFWLGNNLGQTEKLENDYRILQTELFKLQNKDDAVYKEAYANNTRTMPAEPTKPQDQSEPAAEKKPDANIANLSLDAKAQVKSPTVADVPKVEKTTSDPKPLEKKTIEKTKNLPVAKTEAIAEPKATQPEKKPGISLASLLPKAVTVKEDIKSTFLAKVDSVSFQAKESRLRFGIIIKSTMEGGLVGGGIRAKLTYQKKGDNSPTTVTLPSAGYDRSGKFLFLSTEKGSPKEIEFQLNPDAIETFEKLEISLLSSNCLNNVENCREAIDTADYEIPLNKTKLANSEKEKEAG